MKSALTTRQNKNGGKIMKKIISAILVVMLVFGMLPVFAMAADTTATITFDATSKRTVFNTNQQVWVENGITVTNNKSASTSNVADDQHTEDQCFWGLDIWVVSASADYEG